MSLALSSPPRKPAARAALEAPFAHESAASRERAMQRGRMPRDLAGLLRWYLAAWADETPMTVHKSEVWRDHGLHAEGGSKLGTPAYADPFRRYLENAASQIDEDGFYLLPIHAALFRLHSRWPLTSRALFNLAQSGGDWRSVAVRLHYAEEMFCLYLTQSLAQLWVEYRAEVVRLD